MEEFDGSEMHRIESRVRRLNALGFDVAELDITTDFAGSTIRIQPKVVDAGSPLPPAAPADRAGHRGEPGPPAAQRPGLLPGPHRPAERRRGDRRPPVADRAVRAGGQLRAPRDARQAGAGRALPRGAGAPVVPERAGRPGGRRPGAPRRPTSSPCCTGCPTRRWPSAPRRPWSGWPTRSTRRWASPTAPTTSRTTPGRTATRVPGRRGAGRRLSRHRRPAGPHEQADATGLTDRGSRHTSRRRSTARTPHRSSPGSG